MDYEIHNHLDCPFCGENELRSRDCDNLFCESGFTDLYDDDPTNYPLGTYTPCNCCVGAGIIWWYPSCGENIDADKIDFPDEAAA
jgi:hypothetical protein